MGNIYKVKLLNTGKEMTFEILESYKVGRFTGARTSTDGPFEYIEDIISDANPKNGTISDRSPLGEKLLISKVGDVITINGFKYMVLSATYNK